MSTIKEEIRRAGANQRKTRGTGKGKTVTPEEQMGQTNQPEPPAPQNTNQPPAPVEPPAANPPAPQNTTEPPAPNPPAPVHPVERYSPLKGAVDQKTYQAPAIDPNLGAVPEFEFQIQSPQFEQGPNVPPVNGTPTNPPTNGGPNQPPAAPTGPAPVPGSTQLNEQERRQGAELLVDMIISGYKSLHKMAQMAVEVSDEDLFEMHVEKKLDMNMRIPVNDAATEFVSLRDFFAEFNKQTKEALVVSDEFVAAIREPMIRVCVKYGWYMKDEYYILYKFGEDLGIKTMMVVNFKKTINKTLKTFMWVYEQQQAKQNTFEPPSAPETPPAPSVPETPEAPAQ